MKRSATQAVKPEQSGFAKFKTGMAKADRIIDLVGTWIFRLRKIVMAAPVIYYAIKLAAYNGAHLPEQVGIDLQVNGAFAHTISRQLAVMGPLALTGACLVFMFCSRRAMYSWAVSIFTLVLPILLLVSNLYPA